VTRIGISFVCLFALPALAADAGLSGMLKNVEERYNRIQSLQVSFNQAYKGQGPQRKAESGELYLRKPGRMRWDYASPEGKFFLCDAKNFYYYSPNTGRAEKMKLKEADDLRAPLAFLLGKLNFSKDFAGFEAKTEGDVTVVTAAPKSDKLPYRRVEFDVTSSFQIKRMVITGQDSSVMEFRFGDEKLNPNLADTMFKFKLPAGAELVEEHN
jgi:outer membrane lipoprotein carrier protein